MAIVKQTGMRIDVDYDGKKRAGKVAQEGTVTILGFLATGSVRANGDIHFTDGAHWAKQVEKLAGDFILGERVTSLIEHEFKDGKKVREGNVGTVVGPCADDSLEDRGSRIRVEFEAGILTLLVSQLERKDPSSDTTWSSEQSALLCRKGEESTFEGKATLLDISRFSSVSQAVETLNGDEGSSLAPDGFCVVFSANREAYFLAYRYDKQTEALKRFGL